MQQEDYSKIYFYSRKNFDNMLPYIVKKCLGINLTSVSKYEDKKFMLHCRKALSIFLYVGSIRWFHRKIAR